MPRTKNSVTWTESLLAETKAEILEHISEGGTFVEYQRQHNDVPAQSVLHLWLSSDPVFKTRYYEARDRGFDVIAERLLLTARGLTEEQGGWSNGNFKRDDIACKHGMDLLRAWSPRRYGHKPEADQPATSDARELGERINSILERALKALAHVPAQPVEEDPW